MELKRSSTGHIDPDQAWHVKSVGGSTVYIKMGGGSNSFAHKHILASSKQDGVDDDTKMRRRLWHRVDKGGTHADNPDKGAKKTGTGVMSRGDKYGKALTMATNKGDPKSTVICLSMLDLDTVLVDIANALEKWDGKSANVAIAFSKPCVKTVDLAGNVTPATNAVKVQVHAIHGGGYEITHLVT
jgi:hypothetical protein